MRAATLSVAVVLALASWATAGDYHSGLNLRCAECHIMHYSQSHGYNPDGGGFFLNPGAGGPFHFLLRDEVNNLCLACHDGGGFAPDVYRDNGAGIVRLAGALNRLGDTGPYFETTGHTLDSTATAPGSDPAWSNADGLNCVDCHHQHGRGNGYRNLVGDPGNLAYPDGLVTYEIGGTPTNTVDAFERTAASYDEGDMDWQEPDSNASAISKWCGGCHTNFHGSPGDPNIGGTGSPPEEFLRHPVAGVDIGALGGGHSSLSQYQGRVNKVKVMDPTGDWANPDGDETPMCLTCHKAHGNQNSYGLIYRSGGGTLTEEGDTLGDKLEHLCGQCHRQAAAFSQ